MDHGEVGEPEISALLATAIFCSAVFAPFTIGMGIFGSPLSDAAVSGARAGISRPGRPPSDGKISSDTSLSIGL
jgi:hypothetical protein